MTALPKTLVVLAIGSTLALSQSMEDRFRAKYGRSTPKTEARQAAERANTAYRDAAPSQATDSKAGWAEQRHKSKLGRATPAEEKRLDAEKANTAYRDVSAPPQDRWYDNYLEKKYGRSAPKK